MMVPLQMIGRKVIIVPVHKKELKTMLINYRPIIVVGSSPVAVTCFNIFSKIFEKIIFTSMFAYFIENELFTVCQSGFLPGDSCTLRLLSIIHEIQNSFDESIPIDIEEVSF